jgi:hypothetical protein
MLVLILALVRQCFSRMLPLVLFLVQMMVLVMYILLLTGVVTNPGAGERYCCSRMLVLILVLVLVAVSFLEMAASSPQLSLVFTVLLCLLSVPLHTFFR